VRVLKITMKGKLGVILALLVFGFSGVFVYADTPTPTPTGSVTPTPATSDNSQTVDQLNQQISDLEQKISDLQSQGDTLSSQISVMNSQIQLTQDRINATQAQIMSLTMDISSATQRMNTLEASLTNVSKVLISHIVASYQAGSASDMQVLLSSNDISDLLTKENYLKFVQEHDTQLLYDTQQARDDYAHQKSILEGQKKQVLGLETQLQQYTSDLNSQKQAKQDLLTQTQGDEATYESMLSAAQAQLNAFKSFTVSSGGSLLPPQPSPDGWYYNQRDSRWGDDNIGSSSEPMWEVGCLVTSVAMVLKEHGVNVTPADVAHDSSYFFSDTAYMNLPWGGGKFTSSWGDDQSAIDSKLAAGEPVIVAVRGGAHFVVLKSGSNGNYIMDDPWYGPNLNFSDYYSSISQYGWYND
jgi:peptidoglycan hydrolase CwlO-like protein